MPIFSYYIQKHWEAVDAWLWEAFDFGLYELGYLAEDLLIEVTR
jgi:hypothetical protein